MNSDLSMVHPLWKAYFKSKGDTNQDEDYVVSQALIDRIKVNNMPLQLENAVNKNTHNVHTCISCQKKEGEILERQFIRKCKNYLEEGILSQRVENHLLQNNVVTLIGEIAADLPKPTEKGQVIWKNLLKKNVKNSS